MLRAPPAAAAAAFTIIVLGAGVGAAGESESTGDPGRGALAFVRQCALCHTVEKDGPNRFGPNLFGITDRKAGTATGFAYSPAFKAVADWTWSESGVGSFIAAPGAAIPGSKMAVFQGVSDHDGADIVAFLATQK
jgi:cytochrome c